MAVPSAAFPVFTKLCASSGWTNVVPALWTETPAIVIVAAPVRRVRSELAGLHDHERRPRVPVPADVSARRQL